MGASAVKRTISLPIELIREVEAQAESEHKSFSGVMQSALWEARRRLAAEFKRAQDYWSRKARECSILTAADLKRYLAQ